MFLRSASSRGVFWEMGGLAAEIHLIVLFDRGVFEANNKISSLLFLWPWESRDLGREGILLPKKLGNSLDFPIPSQAVVRSISKWWSSQGYGICAF